MYLHVQVPFEAVGTEVSDKYILVEKIFLQT